MNSAGEALRDMGGSLSFAVRSEMRLTFQPYRLSCHAQRQPVPAATPPKSTVPMRRVVWPSRGAAVDVERARTRRIARAGRRGDDDG